MKYTITLTDKQLSTITRALFHYFTDMGGVAEQHKIENAEKLMGQLDEVVMKYNDGAQIDLSS